MLIVNGLTFLNEIFSEVLKGHFVFLKNIFQTNNRFMVCLRNGVFTQQMHTLVFMNSLFSNYGWDRKCPAIVC